MHYSCRRSWVARGQGRVAASHRQGRRNREAKEGRARSQAKGSDHGKRALGASMPCQPKADRAKHRTVNRGSSTGPLWNHRPPPNKRKKRGAKREPKAKKRRPGRPSRPTEGSMMSTSQPRRRRATPGRAEERRTGAAEGCPAGNPRAKGAGSSTKAPQPTAHTPLTGERGGGGTPPGHSTPRCEWARGKTVQIFVCHRWW